MDGISCKTTRLFLFTFVCSLCIYGTITSALVERNFKGHCSRPTSLLYDKEQLQCYSEMVSKVTVQRKLKGESDITLIKERSILPSNDQAHMHTSKDMKEKQNRKDTQMERREMFQ